MHRLVLASVVVSLALFGANDGLADPTLPVTLSVVGHGVIHVRLAEGRVAPCDSSSNRPILDAWVKAGTTIPFAADGECVCVDHTYGTFRDKQWSLAKIACRPVPSRFHRQPDPVVRLVVSTDDP